MLFVHVLPALPCDIIIWCTDFLFIRTCCSSLFWHKGKWESLWVLNCLTCFLNFFVVPTNVWSPIFSCTLNSARAFCCYHSLDCCFYSSEASLASIYHLGTKSASLSIYQLINYYIQINFMIKTFKQISQILYSLSNWNWKFNLL